MNKARWGFVCLWLCLLIYGGCIVSRRTTVDNRMAVARDEPFGPIPDTLRLRILAKEQLVEEVASGRLTLFATAALFRELDGMPPRNEFPTHQDPPIRLECSTEDERYCVRVITFAWNSLRATPAQPGRAEIVTERLVAEFEAERNLSGTIRLPDPRSLEPIHRLLRRCARAGLPAPTTTTAPGEDP
jgi:hypothetical protein